MVEPMKGHETQFFCDAVVAVIAASLPLVSPLTSKHSLLLALLVGAAHNVNGALEASLE